MPTSQATNKKDSAFILMEAVVLIALVLLFAGIMIATVQNTILQSDAMARRSSLLLQQRLSQIEGVPKDMNGAPEK